MFLGILLTVEGAASLPSGRANCTAWVCLAPRDKVLDLLPDVLTWLLSCVSLLPLKTPLCHVPLLPNALRQGHRMHSRFSSFKPVAAPYCPCLLRDLGSDSDVYCESLTQMSTVNLLLVHQ